MLVIFLAAFLSAAHAQHLSPLGAKPDWTQLEAFQETITHDEFVQLLEKIYAPKEAAKKWIEVAEDRAEIVMTGSAPNRFALRFAKDQSSAKNPPRFWRPASALPALNQPAKPLAGLRVALDPGHLGGKWAKMEERWFRVANGTPVTEGDMTLRVAKLLAPKLRELGATVSLVRDSSVPTTGRRPANLRAASLLDLRERQHDSPAALTKRVIANNAERLFYRVAEIHGRARFLNEQLQPDLALCLHFNAEGWGNSMQPVLTEKNHLHVLANGCYQADELAFDDVRFEMLLKLLTWTFGEERGAGEAVAKALAAATHLPAYTYHTDNALPVGETGYLWARNLLASRLFRCPVIYVEPYVMNNPSVIQRIELGDYEGEHDIGGVKLKSIFREYADAVAEGLALYYQSGRGR